MPVSVNLKGTKWGWKRLSLATICLLPAPMLLHGSGRTLEVVGATYEEVVVRSTSLSHITISHKAGISQIPMEALPPDWQDEFGYDPAVAARHRARIDAETRYRVENRKADNPPKPAPPTGYTKLKQRIDFRDGKPSSFTYAKDQGRRPVNDIYAVVTALEYAYSRKDPPVKLSEEFVLWALIKTYPNLEFGKSLHFPQILKSIEIRGICSERLLRNKIARPVDEVDPPSPEAINDARQRRGIQTFPILAGGAKAVAQILYNLNRGRPVVVALRWPNSNTFRQNATLRAQEPQESAVHVVTLIGYHPDPAEPGTVLFLFRNSFGPRWGTGGHGYLALEYLNRHMVGGFALSVH